jgi:hypothetical protein
MQFLLNNIITDKDGSDFQCICCDDDTAVFAKVVDPPTDGAESSQDWTDLFALSQHVDISVTAYHWQPLLIPVYPQPTQSCQP